MSHSRQPDRMVLELDLANLKKVIKMPELNHARMNHSSTVHGNNLYVYGGQILTE